MSDPSGAGLAANQTVIGHKAAGMRQALELPQSGWDMVT
jgi:hypothetical protein